MSISATPQNSPSNPASRAASAVTNCPWNALDDRVASGLKDPPGRTRPETPQQDRTCSRPQMSGLFPDPVAANHTGSLLAGLPESLCVTLSRGWYAAPYPSRFDRCDYPGCAIPEGSFPHNYGGSPNGVLQRSCGRCLSASGSAVVSGFDPNWAHCGMVRAQTV